MRYPPRIGPPAVIALLTTALAAAGCTTTLTSPPMPTDPVRVLVLDHGYHTSLVLPAAPAGSVRYAFGDWRYFALNEQGLLSGAAALLWPTAGALGRRELPRPADPRALAGSVPTVEVAHRLTVERDAAQALRRRLDARFAARGSERVDAPWFGLSFVPDPRDYWLFHNSNHAVARWLEALGVTVDGWPVYASWRLAPPRPGCHD